MRTLVAVLALVALASAASLYEDIDWTTIQPAYVRLQLPSPLKEKLQNRYEEDRARIVGGIESWPHSLPYVGGLISTGPDGNFWCGGSVLSGNFFMTAAHCVDRTIQVQVRLGAHRIFDEEPTQVRIFTTNFVQHPQWDSSALINDIAIVRFPTTVALTAHIQPVGLPRFSDFDNNFSGQAGRLSGWGTTSDASSTLSQVLMEVFVGIETNFWCNVQFLGGVSASHVCTSGSGGVGACAGDSGAPLTIGIMQVGLVSFGLGLGCELGWPTVHTRVTHYLHWIQANSDVQILP